MAQKRTNTQRTVMLVCDYSLTYLGGAQVAFLRQVKALLSEGWSVIVVAPGATKALEQHSTPLLTAIDPHIRWSIPALDLPILGGLKKLEKRIDTLLAEANVDAVIAHSEFGLAAMVMRCCKRQNVPILQTVHTFFWRAPRGLGIFAPLVTLFHTRNTKLPASPKFTGDTAINNALRSMTLRFAANVDVVLSPSKHQAEALTAAGLSTVRVLSNVIQPIECEPPAVDGPVKIVWAGRFAPEKRLPIALKAAEIAAKELGDGRFELHIAGGSHPDSTSVKVHGRLPNSTVSDLIRDSHAVLVTSVGFDNQPMIILEGFAKHRPAIVSDPILRQEFGDAAILADDIDAAGLAKTLIRLVKHPEVITVAGAEAGAYAAERIARMHAERLSDIIDTVGK